MDMEESVVWIEELWGIIYRQQFGFLLPSQIIIVMTHDVSFKWMTSK